MIFLSRLWSFKEKLIIIVFDHDQLFVTLIMIKNDHDLDLRCKLCRLFYRYYLPEHFLVGNLYVFTTLMGPRCLKVIKVNFLNSKSLKKIVLGSCIYKINSENCFWQCLFFDFCDFGNLWGQVNIWNCQKVFREVIK